MMGSVALLTTAEVAKRREEHLTTREAAAAAWTTPARIRGWARRGLIRPASRVEGRPLYALADVLACDRATRETTRARGGRVRCVITQSVAR